MINDVEIDKINGFFWQGLWIIHFAGNHIQIISKENHSTV